MQKRDPNVVWHEGYVQRADFERKNGHRAAVCWLTGLSGSGKSTLAREMEWSLFEQGHRVFVLDGDNVRHGLNRDLSFSPTDRKENIRRVGELAKLFWESGAIVITAFISPYREDRALVRELFPAGAFHEIHVHVDLETAKSRDPKGLYAKALKGEIPNFTGVSAPYEVPEKPELILRTHETPLRICTEQFMTYLVQKGILPTAT